MREEQQTVAVLDVGGTFVKHALFINGTLDPASRHSTPIDERAESQEILDVFISCIGQADSVSICMPGPMDYATGKSLMKHKFQSLYGVELKSEIEQRTGISCYMAHDVVAFLAGVIHLGEAENVMNPAAVTLGTGLGYAYARQHVIQKNELGSPAHPLWNEPYRDGIAEAYVSARAIVQRYNELTGSILTAKEIAIRAQSGDVPAKQVFFNMGCALGELLEKRVAEDGIDSLILGGQICLSANLFLPALTERLSIPVTITQHLLDAPLHGAYAMSTL